jgi:hypothetical protein
MLLNCRRRECRRLPLRWRAAFLPDSFVPRRTIKGVDATTLRSAQFVKQENKLRGAGRSDAALKKGRQLGRPGQLARFRMSLTFGKDAQAGDLERKNNRASGTADCLSVRCPTVGFPRSEI